MAAFGKEDSNGGVCNARDGGLVFWLGLLILTAGFGIARAADRQELAGHAKAALNRVAIARLEPTSQLRLAISLPLRNTNELNALLTDIYDPASANFRHYVTPEEFTRRFGPTTEDYAAVIAFCHTNGMTIVGTHPNRTIVDVSLSAGAAERVFHTSLQVYRHPRENRTYYAPAIEPSVDLATRILHIDGLDSLKRPRALLRRTPMRAVSEAGSGKAGNYLGKDFRDAYAPGVTLNGSGQIVGLVEFDGYYPNDITTYENTAGLSPVNLETVLVDGFDGKPGLGNGEVALDIQMAVAMAPGLSRIVVYETGNGSPSYDILNRIATDNVAKEISCSWTWGTYDPGTDQIFQQYAAQGQSFFQASGDSGAYVGAVDAPADNPFITVVGGTTLTTASRGVWSTEVAWGDLASIGTGGGVSKVYSMPAWQVGVNAPASGGRNIPDVAMVSDNVISISDNGQTYSTGGTSISAPLWAAFTALVNQQAVANGQPLVGFINPIVYGIGRGPDAQAAFHDITKGANTTQASPGNYHAAPGYDLCTGWGTPTGSNTISLLLQGTASPDLAPPNLNIVSHSDSEWVSSRSITLAGTASDAGNGDDGIASVTVNGTRAAGDTAVAGGVADWSRVVKLVPGTNSIVVVAKDARGNATTSTINVISDTSVPALTVANVSSGQRWSNAVFTVRGLARDNGVVTNVFWQLNGSDWNSAAMADGSSGWTADLLLTTRFNTLRAYAVDAAGNCSATNSVRFLYIASESLTVDTNGVGTVKNNYNGKLLEVGQNYMMTAVPAKGNLFSNWMDGTGLVLTNGTVLRFTMQSNLTLVANFVPNPFFAASGNYAGLFYTTNSAGVMVTNSGYITASVTSSGAFTARVQQGGRRYSLSGRFGVDGSWSSHVIGSAAGVAVALQLDVNGGDILTGWISNEVWLAEILANRLVYSKTNPSPQAGQYTLIVPGSSDPASLPGGYGALAVQVSSQGVVNVSGALADGEPVTASTLISKLGRWPLYGAQYNKAGIVIGWLAITNGSDIGGVVGWIKPAQAAAKIFPTGWPYELFDAFGSAFTNATPLLGWTSGAVILEDGNLAQSVTNKVRFGAVNRALGTNGSMLTISTAGPRAGLFTGKVVMDAPTKAVKTINGAVLQNGNAGYGWFLGTNQSGSVFLNGQ